LPRHPAQHATNGMAGLLARGSLQLAAFPTCLLRDRHQWLRASAHRLQLRGQPWVCIGVFDAYHIPSSLFRSKEAIKGASTTLQRGVVNGGLLSRLGRCITLAPLSGARPSIQLAGETGSRCELLLAVEPLFGGPYTTHSAVSETGAP